jgi:hypothetical protein
MIKINERFSIEKTPHAWVLHEEKPSEYLKDGETIQTVNKSQTFWSDIITACNAIIDRSCDKADNVHTIIDCINDARRDVLRALGGYKITEVELLAKRSDDDG